MQQQISIAPCAATGPVAANLSGRFEMVWSMTRVFVLFLVLSLNVDASFGQQADQVKPKDAGATQTVDSKQSEDKAPSENGEKPKAMPSLIQELPDYSGDLATRKFLTGDWGGTRQELAEKGFLIDLELNQVFQGNAHGGKNTKDAAEYAGSYDLTLRFDTARMGLWPGGLLTLRAETWFGHNIHGDVGSIMVANADNLFPVPGDSGETTLSEFYFTQALSEKFAIQAGKVDMSRQLDQNAFASNERTQFMNLGMRTNPALLPMGPYTCMTAAAVYMPTKWLTIATGVNDNDPDGAVTQTGFNTAFHGRDWYSIGQEYDFTIKPWEKEGHQRFGWAWTSRDFVALESDGRLGLELGPIRRTLRLVGAATGLREPATTSDSYVLYYNFDQYLYTEADDPKQGFGLFGRFGYSTGEANPIEQFYSIGVGGKGIVPERDKDTYGLGYYFVKLTDELPEKLNLESEQGVELYYSIEVTPWFHLTPDLQVIVNPGGGDRDVAVVYGIRGFMTF